MKAPEFCYWLQGFFEINGVAPLTVDQSQVIQNHLNLVFLHDIDPKQGLSQAAATLAQTVHDGKIGGTDSDGVVYRC